MVSTGSSPKALQPPKQSTTLIDGELIDRAIAASRKSDRKRIILPLHKNDSSNLHRMLNAVQPGSYIQPHQHAHPPKAESIIVIRGAILIFIFDNQGNIEQVEKIAANSNNLGIDSEPCIFHTFLALEPDTVLFEVKPGPYVESDDKEFAPWAPKEGSLKVDKYMEQLYKIGEKMTAQQLLPS